jgi:hypothetical protein
MRHRQLDRPLAKAPRSAWPAPQGALGFLLLAVAWPASWLHIEPLGEYAFFPIWLGYILMVDALVLRRTGTSLLTRSRRTFAGMFLASVPLWWTFEGINQFTRNWYYLGAEQYSPLRYALVASWHFSIVLPAVFETAALVGSLGWVTRLRHGPLFPVWPGMQPTMVALGLLSLAGIILWPRYAFFATWLCLFLILDPINHWWGRPSLLAQVRRGDWRTVAAFAGGALICGWFWEMWNYWAFPRWEYNIPFLEFAHIFEMPLPGYLGYLPFGLEIYAAYHFMAGLVERLGRYSRRIQD